MTPNGARGHTGRGRVANCSFAAAFFKSIPISLRNAARRRKRPPMPDRNAKWKLIARARNERALARLLASARVIAGGNQLQLYSASGKPRVVVSFLNSRDGGQEERSACARSRVLSLSLSFLFKCSRETYLLPGGWPCLDHRRKPPDRTVPV